jgi:hypothetical protein
MRCRHRYQRGRCHAWLLCNDCVGEWNYRIVVLIVRVMIANTQINYLVPRSPKVAKQLLF